MSQFSVNKKDLVRFDIGLEVFNHKILPILKKYNLAIIKRPHRKPYEYSLNWERFFDIFFDYITDVNCENPSLKNCLNKQNKRFLNYKNRIDKNNTKLSSLLKKNFPKDEKQKKLLEDKKTKKLLNDKDIKKLLEANETKKIHADRCLEFYSNWSSIDNKEKALHQSYQLINLRPLKKEIRDIFTKFLYYDLSMNLHEFIDLYCFYMFLNHPMKSKALKPIAKDLAEIGQYMLSYIHRPTDNLRKENLEDKNYRKNYYTYSLKKFQEVMFYLDWEGSIWTDINGRIILQ